MAYHNLDDKNIPLTTLGTAYEPPAAQPVAQPVAYAVPVAQSYTPYAQPVTPAPYAQPAPSSPSTIEELRAAVLTRQVEFSCGRYIKESNNFYRRNGCKLVAVGLLWGVVGFLSNLIIDVATIRHLQHHSPPPLNDTTACVRKRDAETEACGGKIGCFVTQCDADGSFSRKQSYGSVGSCWCVDEEGLELEGSRNACTLGTSCDSFSVCNARRDAQQAACAGKIGCFVTQCNADGSFASKQKWGSTGACFCVDEDGGELMGTRQTCNVTTNCDTMTECLARRAAEQAECPGPGCFVTQCDSDGSFSSVQRWGSTGQCWCVDEDGIEMNNTRVSGVSCSKSLNCEAEDDEEQNSDYYHHYVPPHTVMPSLLWVFLHLLLGVLVWTPALASAYVAVFNGIVSNSPIKFRDFFACFKCSYYCSLVPLSLANHLIQGALSILVIPGIWWALASMFAVPLHHQHRYLRTCGSISTSIKVVHHHFCNIFGFVLLLALMQILGFLCLIVGLLYTMPLAFVAICFCYHDLIGIKTPATEAVVAPVAVHI